MIVSARTHERMMSAVREELAVVRAKLELLTTENAGLRMQGNLQWTRIAQLEKERAILFREVTHLPIPVPEIINTPVPSSADHILDANRGIFDHIESADERAFQGERIPTS